MTDQHGNEDPRVTQLLSHLIEQTGEYAVILLDPDGKILWCNPATEPLFSIQRPDLVGRAFHEIFTARDQAAGMAGLEMAVAASSNVSEDDRWHKRSDGTEFWSSGVLLRLTDPVTGELIGFGKILRDRTDFKTQLDLLANRQEKLDRTNRDKDRAITNLSHELRNVIAGIRGSIEILDRPLDNEALRLKFGELIRRQLGMVEHLVEDLLDVKRAGSGAIALKKERLVMQDELRALLETFQSRLTQRQLKVDLLAPPVPILIDADRQRLQQIFGNLLENALKYTPPGGRIWVKATIEDGEATVHVEDTGRGIPHEMLRTIFDMFTQVDAGQSGGGLGVGLALVRELVALHGGTVSALSQGVDMGSRFSVRLPLAPSARPDEP